MGFKTNQPVSGGGGGSATVKNSDNSYSTTVASGGTLTLPDTAYDIYLNGVLRQSTTLVTLKTDTINITIL